MTDTDEVNRIRLMYSGSRHNDVILKVALAAVLVSCAVAFMLYRAATAIETPAAAGIPTATLNWKDSKPLKSSSDWSAFRSREGSAVSASAGALARRFRLTGTFFHTTWKAVIADLKDGSEKIVGSNDTVSDVKVVRVFKDGVVLLNGDVEEQLSLNFSRPDAGPGATVTGTGSTGSVDVAVAAKTGTDRFGIQRVGDNRWVFQRQNILSYYQELMGDDSKDRLLSLFDSLHPLYDDKKKITGYKLKVEGEKEFFEAVGLKEGDVVRKVNALPMTSQRTAEHFIKEFVADRASAFVFEIERDGQTQKLVYQVR